ncbi:MAG: hypothetical protein JNK60_17425 [Acidobacteria bacterium]|nr:hypothetical protein [Acidobacteriota bacterium]
MRFAAAAVAASSLLSAALAVRGADVVPPDLGRVRSETGASRVVVDAVVKDSSRRAVPGLGKDDFRVKVDGKPVALESVEWIPAGRPEVTPEELSGLPGRSEVSPSAPMEGSAVNELPKGRLIVFFVQSDIGRFRTLGHMRLLHEMGPFIADLREDDRVAVVSFLSHLVLRLDFTNDQAAIRRALGRAIYHDEPPRPEQTVDGPSLLARLPADEAFNAYYVEDGLRLVAEALEPLAGAKSILFLGWGIGINRVPKEERLWAEAISALYKSRTRLSALDVSTADYHTLEENLSAFAEMSGGSYQKTHLFPGLALKLASEELAGRYVLVFEKPSRPAGVHRIEVSLPNRKGEVYARPYYID